MSWLTTCIDFVIQPLTIINIFEADFVKLTPNRRLMETILYSLDHQISELLGNNLVVMVV